LISQFRFATRIFATFIFLFIISLTLTAAAQTWKIMPVGNSITFGRGGSDEPDCRGYRDDLYTLLRNGGITNFQLVGPNGDSPYNGFFENGRKIEDFNVGGVKDITSAMNTYQPDILLVHLGTNNMNNDNAQTAASKLESLLNYTLTWSITKRILVCKIIPRLINGGTSDPKVAEYNAEIERMFFEHQSNSTWDKITLVNMYYLFDPPSYTNLPDGTHPNDAGYAKMAQEYYSVLSQIIKQYPNDDSNPGNITLQGGAYGTSAQVSWTAVGDNNGSGQANLYELRYAATEITAENYSRSTLISLSKPKSSGSSESILVPNLVSGLTYHFRIRVYDEWNNKSNLSNDLAVVIPPPTIEFCTDFCESPLPNWSLHPSFSISNCELSITSAQPGWNYLAVYTGASYTPSAKYVESSFHWSASDDEAGVNATGMAMMLDNPSYLANGYLIKVRDNTISLFEIRNGRTETSYSIGSSATAVGAIPQPGDTLKVRYSFSASSGHVFNAYLNRNWLGSVNDAAKRQGNASRLYSGAMLYGSYNNNIDDYCVSIPPLEPDSMRLFAGDNQHGPVKQKLLTPLSVKLLDVNGNSVANVPVDFAVSSGEGTLSTHPDSLQFNDNLWIEAESGDAQPPMQLGGDSEASGKEYAYVNPEANSNGKGVAAYKIYVPKSGNYKLWIRYIAPDGNKNSCSFSIAGSDTFDWTPLDLTSSWSWTSRSPNTFNLNAGFVDFAFKNRESGTKIDKFLLTKSSTYTPVGTGGTTQAFSFITDASGVAYTFLTFGTHAGLVEVTATAQVANGSPLTFQEYADAGNPISMAYASPSILTGPAGLPLDSLFKVLLTDQYGNKCSGISVNFAVKNGDGTFDSQSSIEAASNTDGIAGSRLTLGYSETNVEAKLPDYPNISSLLFKGSPNGNVPVRVDLVAGGGQTDTVAQKLGTPLRVKVLDGTGQAVRYFNIVFRVTRGNGFLNTSGKNLTVPTDANGEAWVSFTLGDTSGTNTNIVMVDAKLGEIHLTNSPIQISVTALPDRPQKIEKVSGDGNTGNAGETFPMPLTVKVSDQHGNGIKGHSVTFSVQSGNGNFDGLISTAAGAPKTISTDSLGKAQVYYTAGSQTGSNQVKADGGSAAGSQYFTLNVLQSRAKNLVRRSDEHQAGTVANVLSAPFKVGVTDPFGANKPGAAVRFKVVAGGGKLSGINSAGNSVSNVDSLTTLTDSDGNAQVTLTLGTAAGTRNNEVRVYSPDYQFTNAPMSFFASASAGAAEKISAVGNTNFTGTPNAGPISLIVKVTDLYDNAKSGHSVTFAITSGISSNGHFDTGTSSRNINTSGNGTAIVSYYMGTSTSEDNTIQATSTRTGTTSQLSGSPVTFIGKVLPGTPADIDTVAIGHARRGRILTQLTDPLTVVVQDQWGNPVPNISVRFRAISDGGKIGSATEADVITDASGKASVNYTLGKKAGTNSDTVEANANGYPQIPAARFYASAEAGDPNAIYFEGDSSWTNKPVKSTITAKAKVTDLYGNPVSNWPVMLKVMQGGGKVGSVYDSMAVYTGSTGVASVNWALGSIPSSNVLHAIARFSGNPLVHSPKIFTAISLAGEPFYLLRVSAQIDTGIIGLALPESVRVKVTDKDGNPIIGHPVQFECTNGSGPVGTLSYGGNTGQALTVYTHEDGTAGVCFTFGQNPGVYGVKASSSSTPGTPSGINFTFFAEQTSAKRIDLLTPTENLQAEVGTAKVIRVAVKDGSGNPVLNYPVKFATPQNSGSLGASHSHSTSKPSQDGGIAEETWTLGTKAGFDTLVISATNSSGAHLTNSPITVIATALAGPADPRKSAIVSQSQPTVMVDLPLTIILRDSFSNPVSGKNVSLVPPDPSVTFQQPTLGTNSLGQTTGTVRSIVLGKKLIAATLKNDTKVVADTVLDFKAGAPAKMERLGGNGQSGNLLSLLKDSLQVQVFDSNNFPVMDVDISFLVSPTSGRFLESMQYTYNTKTDSQGIATTHLILGSTIGVYTIGATSTYPGLSGQTVSFIETAYSSSATDLEKISGDGQRATRDSLVAKAFVVRAINGWGNKANVSVTFATRAPGGTFVGDNPAVTDFQGQAGIRYKKGYAIIDTIIATVPNLSKTVIFTVASDSGKASKLLIARGNNQKGTVMKPLPDSLVVLVTDDAGFGKPNIAIYFSVAPPPRQGSSLSPSSPIYTNKKGEAAIAFTPGQVAGEYKVNVYAPAIPASVEFTCTAGPDVAYTLQKLSGDNQYGTVGRELVYPCVVAVVDRYGNRVANEAVSFATSNGTVASSRVVSDADGEALTWWTISQLGSNTMMAFLSGKAPATFTAYGVSNNFPKFVDLPDSVRIVYGEMFCITIDAADDDNDPLAYAVLDMPFNASFNQGSHTFCWTPTSDQLGTWMLHLRVDDNKVGNEHGFDVDSVRIIVDSTKTSVELSIFKGAVVPYKGVVLDWKTSSESYNLGFDVWRSISQGGKYARINQAIISSREDGIYSFTDSSAVAGRKYYYKLDDISSGGVRTSHGPVMVETSLPQQFQLLQNYPNPFNPQTRIRFQLPKAATIRISIYNVLGQEVRRLIDRQMEPGYHEVQWDGRNETGMQVGSGVFYYRIEAAEFRDTKKMVMLR
jgi:lysophospholipase L1-like esterase